MNFETLGLETYLSSHLTSIGFITPTPIQQKVITTLSETGDTDIIALAQTGTGKTAAFGLPLIQRINFEKNHLQAVILSPTRELCVQISKDLEVFSKPVKNAKTIAVYGGASIENQITQIKRGGQIIVATPGRFLDLLKRKVIKPEQVNYIVFDEADEMLNMGFKTDIDTILSYMDHHRYIWLFSATMSQDVRKIAMTYMNSPIEISVGDKNATALNIVHEYFTVSDRNRYPALKRILDFHPNIYGLIFCRTKRDTQKVAEKLIEDGYNSAAIHGDLSQAQRDSVMASFRSKALQILVATDVAARGIDVDKISHVINYQLPDDTESYTHRSGRTARAGNKGTSIVLVTPSEQRKIREIERIAKTKFEKKLVPGGQEICEQQLLHLIDTVKNVEVDEKAIAPFLITAAERLEAFTSEDIIKRFFAVEFNKFLTYYKNAKDLNIIGSDREERRSSSNSESRGERSYSSTRERSGDRSSRERTGRFDSDARSSTRSKSKFESKNEPASDSFERFFIDMGEKDDLNKGLLIRSLCDTTGIESKYVGRINIRDNFSFIDIDRSMSKKFLTKLSKGFKIKSKDVSIQPAKS